MSIANHIVGTERSEGNGYPPDWLCICGHRLDQHKQENNDPDLPCDVRGVRDDSMNPMNPWVDRCVKYVPEDNLNYIERVAKVRNL